MTTQFDTVTAETLRAHGVQTMFGVMGDANMYIADSFVRAGGDFVSAANEGGSVQMAAGYAAVSGRVGVATVTHGAIANAVSALLDATRGGYPVLVIAGDTAHAEGFHLQNIPQREVVTPTGAAYVEVRSPSTGPFDIASAYRLAEATRRPVVIGVPADFQLAECEDSTPPVWDVSTAALAPARDLVEEAAAMLIGANRPLIIAGRGAADAKDTLQALAERIGAPVATTLRGKGLFAGDPYDVGICGTLSHPVAGETIARSDCLLVFGASLSALTTLRGELLAGKRVVQVDTRAEALGHFFPVDLAVHADAGQTAGLLIDILDEADADAKTFRSAELADRIEEWHREDSAAAPSSSELTLTGVLHAIDRVVPDDRSLTIDGGRFSHEALRILRVPRPERYAHCLNVGHIGMSIGYAIGAALADPEVPTLVIVGDGGFMLGGLTEFNTAVRYGARLVVVLLNDSAYGAEYYRFVDQERDPVLTTFAWPSFAEIATTLGGTGVRIESWDDIDQLGRIIEDATGPVLAEVILDRDSIPDPGDH